MAPIGPVLVSSRAIPDPSVLRLRGIKNGTVVQDIELTYVSSPSLILPSPLTQYLNSDLIFPIPKLVSFLSQNTTLKAGTIIMVRFCSKRNLRVANSPLQTGTPGGIGWSVLPRQFFFAR